MKDYVYFISYSYARGGDIGYGDGEFSVKGPITQYLHIKAIKDSIRETKGHNEIVVLFYDLLRIDKR